MRNLLQKNLLPFLVKSQNYLARFGYGSTDSLSRSFSYALKLMYDFIGGSQFRYQLPWVVMLGTSGSGKSTMLESLDLDRPIGRPHFELEDGDKPLCDWWFYDHGIVLDLNGKLVLNASQASSDEDNWQLFLNLLSHHRSKRPLDSIVLTIPASELTGQHMLSHDDIMIRAEYLYGKLWLMQSITGIRVPIYIVITQSDLIPGFESFCKSIPTNNRRDIFGWSNDHAIDSIYTPEWLDEAFSSINSSLYRVQEEIYADGRSTDSRDGVFLFPLTLNQLKGGIGTYIDHLFKPSGYHEAFFLRGIYFVGDSHLEKSVGEGKSSPLEIPLISRGVKKESKRNLYFIDNLFENKIFREVGLARPISRILLGNTTAMRFAKIAVIVAAIIGTLGLLRANETLQNARTNLVPALTQIEITLEKIRSQNEGTEIARVFFDDQAQVLLNTMTQISVNNLTSFFIPASWFDNLDAKIKYVMSLAYDHVIIRSMADELAYKAQQLFSPDTIIPVVESTTHGMNPLQTTGFYRLQSYINAVHDLEQAANKFNELGLTASLKDVGDIIKYLFKYDMPEAFYQDDAYYIDALKHTKTKIFDFDIYRQDASSKLHKLFDAFELAAFDPNEMIPGLKNLMTGLYEFTGARNYTAYDADLLREIFINLQQTNNSIQDPSLQWLDSDFFNPGPQYQYIIGFIVGSNFFKPDTASERIREVDSQFMDFRKRLASYTSPLFKGGHLFQVEDGLAISNPSLGALELQKNLAFFFNEPFMASVEPRTILTAVPIGSILLWDSLRLQEAVNLVTVYNNFINSNLLSMPKELQPMLQKIGRESLTQNLVKYIADAEVFNSNTAAQNNLAPEDALLSQVQNYRAAAPYLEQLLFALRANNANEAFSTLKSLLTTETYKPLIRLDAILNEESPYAIKMNSFIWWTGKNMAALEAFGVSNLTELKNYLELQRDRINYLAREFAEPLVTLLEQVNKEGMPGNLPLATKWTGIINELLGYERKAPGNGLVDLENYIMTPLNEVTLETCNKYADTLSMISADEDFFVSILVDIQEKLHERCVALSSYVSVGNYTQLATFFNTNLAGKFPFVETANGLSLDADPEDIRTFFEMMDTQGSQIKDILKQAKNLGATGKNALTFIEQMEQVRTFFGDYLAPNSTLPYPAFSYGVTFRVNQEREVRANEILNWEFTTQDTTITMRSASQKGYWKAGSPVKVTFRWALNSPLQPQMSEGNPNFEVQGENASYTYTGTWALLRLLRQQQASPSDFDSLQDESPITLRFDIPLINTISNQGMFNPGDNLAATVFVRLQVAPAKMQPAPKVAPPSATSPGTMTQSPIQTGSPVNLPFFPFCAPSLDNTRNP